MKPTDENIITEQQKSEAIYTLEMWAEQQGVKRSLIVITSERQGKDGNDLATSKAMHGNGIQLIGSIISACVSDTDRDFLRVFEKAVRLAKKVIDKNINIDNNEDDKPDSTVVQA